MKTITIEKKLAALVAVSAMLLIPAAQSFQSTMMRNKFITMPQKTFKNFRLYSKEDGMVMLDEEKIQTMGKHCRKSFDVVGLASSLSLCVMLSQVDPTAALEIRNNDMSVNNLQLSNIEKIGTTSSHVNTDAIGASNFLIGNEAIFEKSVDQNGDTNSAQAVAKEGGKWFFIIYIVFSFAVGAVEMTKRFTSWYQNRQP